MTTQAELQLHSERKGVIGGSDVGSIYDLDWGCKRRLWYEKSGIAPDFEEKERPEFERGKYMERVVAEIYADKTQRIVELAPRISHPKYPWMIVHMDRIVKAPEKIGKGYLEIKVVNYRTFKKFMKEGLHGSYILQGQHGLGVTGYHWGSYAILCLEPWLFKYFDFERDEELIATIIEREAQFMSDVQNKAEYVRLAPTDHRCHVCQWRHSCQAEALNGVVPSGDIEGELIERPELLPIAAELRELDQMLGDTEALYNEANTAMEQAIEALAKVDEAGNKTYPPGIKFPGLGVTHRIQPKGSRKWDQPALWGLYDKASDNLKRLLGKYCNDGKTGRPPKAHLKHYWNGA